MVVLLLICAVAGCIALAIWLQRRAFAQATQRWAGNLALVQGKPGRAWTWHGSFEGVPVHWRYQAVHTGQFSASHFHQISLTLPSGGPAWSVRHETDGWRVQSDDTATMQALQQAGAARLMEGWPKQSWVNYEPASGDLTLEIVVGGRRYVPDQDAFLRQLRLLRDLGQMRPRASSAPQDPIGQATMLPDGTIVVDIRAEGPGSMTGDARMTYAPADPKYQAVLHHVGPLQPGEVKPVQPWVDPTP